VDDKKPSKTFSFNKDQLFTMFASVVAGYSTTTWLIGGEEGTFDFTEEDLMMDEGLAARVQIITDLQDTLDGFGEFFREDPKLQGEFLAFFKKRHPNISLDCTFFGEFLYEEYDPSSRTIDSSKPDDATIQ